MPPVRGKGGRFLSQGGKGSFFTAGAETPSAGKVTRGKKKRFERTGVSRVKGGPFAVTLAIDEGRLELLKQTPGAMASVMMKVAEYWHTSILPRHFTGDAHSRYGYAARTERYQKRKGSRPDMIWTGKMKRELIGRAFFVEGARQVRLKMSARVLNFVPNMQESDVNLYVKQDKELKGSRVRKTYPNMKREIRILLPEEHEELTQVAEAALLEVFGEEPAAAPV